MGTQKTSVHSNRIRSVWFHGHLGDAFALGHASTASRSLQPQSQRSAHRQRRRASLSSKKTLDQRALVCERWRLHREGDLGRKLRGSEVSELAQMCRCPCGSFSAQAAVKLPSTQVASSRWGPPRTTPGRLATRTTPSRTRMTSRVRLRSAASPSRRPKLRG